MKNILWILLAMLLTVCLGKIIFVKNTSLYQMKIGDTTIKYELAKTSKEIELGLSYRKSIPENYGMLFVLPKKGLHTFWMHEMQFPLDIVWLDGNKIVQIDKNVPIKTNGAWTMVSSNFPISFVLEMKSGESQRLELQEGNIVIMD